VAADGSGTAGAARLREAARALRSMRARVEELERARSQPVAVIGMACRFPGGGEDPEAFWRLLQAGGDAVCEVPAGRWPNAEHVDPDPPAPGRISHREGGFLDQPLDRMDAAFFGVSAREAAAIDPQQRLLLEVAWEALEHAGLAADRLAGSPAGVFVGISSQDYMQHTLYSGPESINPYSGTGTTTSVAAGRLSYTFGLTGPAVALDTSCSSSLVAIHLAIQSLRSGESRLALAGGVNLLVTPEPTAYFWKLKALSPRGRCRSFDESADGFVRGEGCGVVVLKRLGEALADGDRVLAVLRGSAVNHDGRGGGLTVPNGRSQEAVIRSALDAAELAPGDVDYVETHGTGTPLGDPIEAEALIRLFGAGREPQRPLILGAVKTNVGHLEAAAGVAGLIKVILALEHQEIPPNLHFRAWNPHISLAGAPLAFPTGSLPWPRGGRRRVAGVSSFGMSGTNAHLVVEEAPLPVPAAAPERRALLLTVSARTEEALVELARRYRRCLAQAPGAADVAWTAARGRSHWQHRLAVRGETAGDLDRGLAAFLDGRAVSGVARGVAPPEGAPRIAFLFTGQGAQYPGMGRQLYARRPVFRGALERCDELLRQNGFEPLLELLCGQGDETRIHRTDRAQVALFALEIALVELWRSWGIQPGAVLGHSVGEYAAACTAGVLGLEDALRLVAERGRLMQALPQGGAMANVHAAPELVARACEDERDEVSIAAVNGPRHVVVSGTAVAVERVLARCAAEGISARRLPVSHAFHSRQIEPALGPLARAAAVPHGEPRLHYVSNLTGGLVSPGELGPGYWARQARAPVRFAAGLETLLQLGYRLVLEIGPHPVLSVLGRQNLGDDEALWLSSLKRGGDDEAEMLDSLARLYVRGAAIDGREVQREAGGRLVTLPCYPFQRESFWMERCHPQPAPPSHPLLQARLRGAGREAVFEARLRPSSPAYLADHRVQGQVVVPASALWEMALAAAEVVAGRQDCQLSDVALREPLRLDGEVATVVQVVLRPGEAGWSFEIASQRDGDANGTPWRCHAAGDVAPGAAAGAAAPELLERLRGALPDGVEPAELYERARRRGMDYGPAFRGLRRLWSGRRELLARVELDEPWGREAAAYGIHPALLDACLQGLGALLDVEESGWLPFALDRLERHQRPGRAAWCHAVLDEAGADPGMRTGHCRLLDDGGRAVATLRGVHLRRAAPPRFPGASAAAGLYAVQWRGVPPPALPGSSGAPGSWLVLADRRGLGEALAERLRARGERVALAFAAWPGEPVPGGGPSCDPGDAAALDRLVAGLAGGRPSRGGVVCLWSLDAFGSMAAPAVQGGAILHLVQALARAAAVGRLWLVTAGAQAVGDDDATELSPCQALAWGLGRVVTGEHPEWDCALVDLAASDLAGGEGGAPAVEALMSELLAVSGGDQVAYRGGQRFAARLVPWRAPDADGSLEVPEGPNFELRAAGSGTLDRLRLVPVPLPEPGPGEVRLRVQCTGLNFRDVLNALGLYPGEPGPLGGECAGVVTALGEGVTGLEIGQPVLAIAPGSFRREAVTRACLALPLPKGMTCEQGATVAAAFLTAHHALHEVGRLAAGDTVLIHAAAGGVGLAAVQLAQRAGAEVIATAGSERKRRYLAGLGVRRVAGSRSPDFKRQVLEWTAGRGVDLVLSALAGELVDAGLDVLAPGGRFLEIGKTDRRSPARVAASHPGVSYHPIALDDLTAREPERMGALLAALLRDCAAGLLRALPCTVFPLAEAPRAFRYMQRARHIGKVVVSQQRAGAAIVRPEASYLIAGGAGALGLHLAEHLVRGGARAVVLAGRSAPSPEASARIAALCGQGAGVEWRRCDVAEREEVAGLLDDVAGRLPPLAGVVHAAGALDDGVLREQSSERLARALAAKVLGAWHLHELTAGLPLDFFVLYSSVAAILGSPGQGSYAAANAVLDALASYRVARGLPGLSVAWGPWTDGGMAARVSQDGHRWRQLGIEPIEPAAGLAALDQCLAERVTQCVVLPVAWERFNARFPDQACRPFLSEAAGGRERAAASPAPASRREAWQERLRQALPSQRLKRVRELVAEETRRVLGQRPTFSLDPAQPFHELGLDSLLAVELRNALGSALGVTLPVTLVFDHPSVQRLAEFLAGEIFVLPPEAPAAAAAAPAAAAAAGTTVGELENELLSELERAGY
jgi:acyl transferase domain-containing protein/NADPH:quinone reductase-like Zn-dependent oxidoreductase/acyl carrier protein